MRPHRQQPTRPLPHHGYGAGEAGADRASRPQHLPAHARFPGPILRRTRGPDPSSKATLQLPKPHAWSLCSARREATAVSLAGLYFSLMLALEGFVGHQAAAAAAKLLQSCLALCNPIDGSPPGSPVPGILQARTLEWVAISFSRPVPGTHSRGPA